MKNLNVRLVDSLHARVKEAAAADERSLNSEISWLLRIGLDTRDAVPDWPSKQEGTKEQ